MHVRSAPATTPRSGRLAHVQRVSEAAVARYVGVSAESEKYRKTTESLRCLCAMPSETTAMLAGPW